MRMLVGPAINCPLLHGQTQLSPKDTWEAPATPATLNAGEVLIEHRWIDRGLCCSGMTRKCKGPMVVKTHSINQFIQSVIQCFQTVPNTPFTSFTAPLFNTCAITYSSGNSAGCDVTKGNETTWEMRFEKDRATVLPLIMLHGGTLLSIKDPLDIFMPICCLESTQGARCREMGGYVRLHRLCTTVKVQTKSCIFFFKGNLSGPVSYLHFPPIIPPHFFFFTKNFQRR